MKSKLKFVGLISAIALISLTSCSFTLGGNISTNTDTPYETTPIYESSISVKTTNTSYLSDDNFTYNNIEAKLASTGDIYTLNTDCFVLGGSSTSGTFKFNFTVPILIDQIDLDVFSYMSSSTNAKIYYNDTYFEAILTKNKRFTKTFEYPIEVSSIKFEGNGPDDRLKFKGVSFSSHQVIPVTGIEKIKDVEATVNRFELIDSTYYSVLPESATNKNVILSCDSDYVEIDENRIKCLKEGNYILDIITEDGEFKTSLNVNAIEEVIPENVEKLYKEDIRFTYDSVAKSMGTEGYFPSVGNPNMLVVPVNFSDLTSYFDFNDKTNVDRLNAAFNGTNEDHSNSYSHSLRSFYNVSSYGALDINCIVTDVYTPTISSTNFKMKEAKTDGEGVYTLIEEFYQKGTIDGNKINFKDSKYDLNKDGFVDGIWFIYNENRESKAEDYWPYTYWYYSLDENGYILDSDINISCFANMSVYFTYEDSKVGEDYHTLVHETGHMLGLDDYYSYDEGIYYSATGNLDMMDANIGDHNAFSKFSLGWVEPYVVKDAGEVTLYPFEESGDCLIIPSSYFNDSAFGEYLIIEFYTPTGINSLDANDAYPNRTKFFTEYGIRIFHVDARLSKLVYSSKDYNYVFNGTYLDENATSIESGYDYYYYVGSSNTYSYSYTGYHLIEAVTANNVATYNNKAVNNNSLFKQGDVFNPSIYSSFFKNGKMHDGNSLGYKIEFVEMTNDFCKMNIVKV